MIRAAKRWERSVRRHFDFLTGYGFRLDHVEDRWWATTAAYVSATLGVLVTRSVEFDRVELTLMRLVAGKVPEPEVWVTDRRLDRVLFDNVLEARRPELLSRRPSNSFSCTQSYFVRSSPISSKEATQPWSKAST
jgi:hypothetical protein